MKRAPAGSAPAAEPSDESPQKSTKTMRLTFHYFRHLCGFFRLRNRHAQDAYPSLSSTSRSICVYTRLSSSLKLATFYLLFTALGLGAATKARSPYAEQIARLEPMSTRGLDSSLASVLGKYYENTFTNDSTWEKIQSIRFDGTLHLPQGVLRFTAFKKKPDYCKVIIFAPNGARIVMAYDGQDAWQFTTTQLTPQKARQSSGASEPTASSAASPIGDKAEQTSTAPEINPLSPRMFPLSMPAAEALNFIRDATTGGHLLYPGIEGKKIEILGITTRDGQRFYELEVTLPDGQQIRSQLNGAYAEVRQITTNNVNADQEVTRHSDFREIDGVRIAFSSTLTVGDQQAHQSRIHKVQTNLGLMPWIFSRPSGAYIPGGVPNKANTIPYSSELSPIKAPLSPGLSGVEGSEGDWPNARETEWSESVFKLDSPAFHFMPPHREDRNLDPSVLTAEEAQALLKDLEAEH